MNSRMITSVLAVATLVAVFSAPVDSEADEPAEPPSDAHQPGDHPLTGDNTGNMLPRPPSLPMVVPPPPPLPKYYPGNVGTVGGGEVTPLQNKVAIGESFLADAELRLIENGAENGPGGIGQAQSSQTMWPESRMVWPEEETPTEAAQNADPGPNWPAGFNPSGVTRNGVPYSITGVAPLPVQPVATPFVDQEGQQISQEQVANAQGYQYQPQQGYPFQQQPAGPVTIQQPTPLSWRYRSPSVKTTNP